MKMMTKFLTAIAGLAFLSSAHSVVIVANDYENLEGAKIEILHNEEKNSGTVIVHKDECRNCAPLTLKYQDGFIYSVNGTIKPYTIDSPRNGQGDISYKPEDMSVGHINFYQ